MKQIVAILAVSMLAGCATTGTSEKKEYSQIEEAMKAIESFGTVALDPGDILLISSYAPHKSDGNKTTDRRRIVYLTYNALSAGDFRQQYYATKTDAIQSKSTGKISKIGHF